MCDMRKKKTIDDLWNEQWNKLWKKAFGEAKAVKFLSDEKTYKKYGLKK